MESTLIHGRKQPDRIVEQRQSIIRILSSSRRRGTPLAFRRWHLHCQRVFLASHTVLSAHEASLYNPPNGDAVSALRLRKVARHQRERQSSAKSSCLRRYLRLGAKLKSALQAAKSRLPHGVNWDLAQKRRGVWRLSFKKCGWRCHSRSGSAPGMERLLPSQPPSVPGSR
jgi:hypothetical protein